MKPWLLGLALIGGCVTMAAPLLPPKPLETPSAIWLPLDIPGEVQLCFELAEPDAAYKYKCYSVATMRIMVNGLRTAN